MNTSRCLDVSGSKRVPCFYLKCSTTPRYVVNGPCRAFWSDTKYSLRIVCFFGGGTGRGGGGGVCGFISKPPSSYLCRYYRRSDWLTLSIVQDRAGTQTNRTELIKFVYQLIFGVLELMSFDVKISQSRGGFCDESGGPRTEVRSRLMKTIRLFRPGFGRWSDPIE